MTTKYVLQQLANDSVIWNLSTAMIIDNLYLRRKTKSSNSKCSHSQIYYKVGYNGLTLCFHEEPNSSSIKLLKDPTFYFLAQIPTLPPYLLPKTTQRSFEISLRFNCAFQAISVFTFRSFLFFINMVRNKDSHLCLSSLRVLFYFPTRILLALPALTLQFLASIFSQCNCTFSDEKWMSGSHVWCYQHLNRSLTATLNLLWLHINLC